MLDVCWKLAGRLLGRVNTVLESVTNRLGQLSFPSVQYR